jgi:hypothetical protein
MKKIAVFLFALGVGLSAFASDPDCYVTCDANYDACLAEHPTATGACLKILTKCYHECDISE